MASVLIYMAMGLLGLPVFAEGGVFEEHRCSGADYAD